VSKEMFVERTGVVVSGNCVPELDSGSCSCGDDGSCNGIYMPRASRGHVQAGICSRC
jgi:hypothetical protein